MEYDDFEYSDYLTGYFFLRKKDAEKRFDECRQDKYEVLVIHPCKNGRYLVLSVYVMPCDVLIEFIRTTTYRIVSIRKLRKQKGNK